MNPNRQQQSDAAGAALLSACREWDAAVMRQWFVADAYYAYRQAFLRFQQLQR